MNADAERDTLEQLAPPSEVEPPKPFSSLVRVDISGLSDVGKVRLNNEDHYLIVRLGRSYQTLMTNLPAGSVPDQFDEIGYGMVVADGMGGMAAGEEASSLAIKTLVSLVLHSPNWFMRFEERAGEAEEVMRRNVERFRQANETLIEKASSDQRLSGMGTTMTMAFSVGTNLFIVHIGDSRAYLFRQGELHMLTNDHTVAQKMIDAGLITAQDEVVRDFRHFLTQAIGMQKGPFKPEVHLLQLADGDQLLLCSDGLTEAVEDEKIAAVLNEKMSSASACQTLVDLALKQGGPDNITVTVAHYNIPEKI
jgi:serine/threonine protein phosphatase PrpC